MKTELEWHLFERDKSLLKKEEYYVLLIEKIKDNHLVRGMSVSKFFSHNIGFSISTSERVIAFAHLEMPRI